MSVSSANISKDEIVLIPMTTKATVSHYESVADVYPLDNLTRNASNVYNTTIDSPIWLPPRSSSSDGVGARIHRGLATEKEMTLLRCCRHFPKAIIWSLLLFLTVVMEAYDKSLISGFFAFPSFRRKYGEPRLPSSDYQGRQDFEISPMWQMGLQNASVSCEIIGLLTNGYISYMIGYRKMMIAALIWLCLAIFPAFFAHNIALLLASQALCGLSWGVIQTLAATYAAEVVPSVIRAAILSNVNMCWLIGQLLGTGILRALVHETSDWSYRLPFALQWAWALPLLFIIYFAPESPWWLVRHERLSEARASLRRLTSNKHLDIEDTITIMQHVDSTEKKLGYGGASFADLFKGSNRRRTEICCMTWSCQALCGASLTGYAPYFLEQAGFESSKSFTLATSMYGLGILGGMISWLLLSTVGRRRLYLSGLVAAVIILTTSGVLSITLADRSSLNWALGSLIILMTFTYNLSIGPACYVIVAEIPSTRLRIKSIALARIVYNIFTIINNIITPQFLNPTAWNLGDWRVAEAEQRQENRDNAPSASQTISPEQHVNSEGRLNSNFDDLKNSLMKHFDEMHKTLKQSSDDAKALKCANDSMKEDLSGLKITISTFKSCEFDTAQTAVKNSGVSAKQDDHPLHRTMSCKPAEKKPWNADFQKMDQEAKPQII
ncbi:general alpha-glucoside permease [Fusarium beomiforme]|uniref:General alpha-glucoside permease n=1 Tax=Fusarium beomiforme TaxID=44412 RepID=A0A9P5ANH8_9HYPO|nr:general alpha-glucoside permease [Fusarium beomiforme]